MAILKIRKGYNPNCSSGVSQMIIIKGALVFAAINAIITIITSIILYRRKIKK